MNVSLTESSDYAYSISVAFSMCKLRMSEKNILVETKPNLKWFFIIESCISNTLPDGALKNLQLASLFYGHF